MRSIVKIATSEFYLSTSDLPYSYLLARAIALTSLSKTYNTLLYKDFTSVDRLDDNF
jgi:hypothetical protein